MERIREKTVMNRTVKEDVERRLDQYAPLRRRRREGEGELGAERGSQRIGSNPLIRQGIEASLFQSSLNCLFMEIFSIVLGGIFPSST